MAKNLKLDKAWPREIFISILPNEYGSKMYYK